MNAQVPVDWTNQEVTVVSHPRLGDVGAIVIDSLALGPAMGGCRFWNYDRFDDALLDARRLARGMSYKNALAGLGFGGGKSVLMKPVGDFDRREVFRAFAEAVDFLEGKYVTAEDVGTKVSDMELVREITPHVFGVTAASGQAGGDPSPWTALGVFNSICAVADRMGEPLGGLRIAIQGLGNVGRFLADLLHERGVELVVADINPAALDAARSKYLATVMSPDEIHRADVDIFAPCALGAVLNPGTIPQIKARAVVGAANNQLAAEADGQSLMARGILYAPDYVVNAGGVINVAGEYLNQTPDQVRLQVDRIGERLLGVLDRASAMGIPTNIAADLMARDVMRAAGKPCPKS